MKIRAYISEDSPVIAKWIRTEFELYQWSSDRFGFVIVDPDVRGKGYGHKMLLLALDYVRENLPLVTRVDLGVFENNPKAKRCYEAAGFKDCGEHMITTPYGDWRCIDMEQYFL